MKKEYILFTIIGFGLLSYLLDAVVNPLSINLELTTPYQFFTPRNLSLYPFSTTSVILKAVALFLASILILGFIGIKNLAKGIILIILSALFQLYAVQDIATSSFVVPLEYSLGLALAGILLLLPAVTFIITGIFQDVNSKLKDEVYLPKD